MDYTFDEEEAQGGNGVYHNPKDLVDHLLLVWAVGYLENQPTRYSREGKASDVVLVDCVDLDQPDPATGEAGLLGRRCWWRNARLIRDLKPKIGNPAPRLVFMTRVPVDYGQPAYELVLASSDDFCRQRGIQWLKAHPDFQPSSPPGTEVRTTPVAAASPAPASQPANVRPSTQSAAPVETTMSQLERLAAQSRANAARLSQQGEPPF